MLPVFQYTLLSLCLIIFQRSVAPNVWKFFFKMYSSMKWLRFQDMVHWHWHKSFYSIVSLWKVSGLGDFNKLENWNSLLDMPKQWQVQIFRDSKEYHSKLKGSLLNTVQLWTTNVPQDLNQLSKIQIKPVRVSLSETNLLKIGSMTDMKVHVEPLEIKTQHKIYISH